VSLDLLHCSPLDRFVKSVVEGLEGRRALAGEPEAMYITATQVVDLGVNEEIVTQKLASGEWKARIATAEESQTEILLSRACYELLTVVSSGSCAADLTPAT
jgi:hypothetical protein